MDDPRIEPGVAGFPEERSYDIVELVIKSQESTVELPNIIVVGREHPGETPASFVIEGFIDAILNSPAGDRLLQSYQFIIIPLLNADGVHHGYYYHNAKGVNLARDWVEFRAAESKLFASIVNTYSQKSKVELVINLHSSNDPEKGHFFLKIDEDLLSEKNASLQRSIFDAAEGKHPQMQTHSPVKLLDLPGIAGNALSRDFGVYCLYHESNYSRGADGSEVTIRSLRETGEALVQTLAEVLPPE